MRITAVALAWLFSPGDARRRLEMPAKRIQDPNLKEVDTPEFGSASREALASIFLAHSSRLRQHLPSRGRQDFVGQKLGRFKLPVNLASHQVPSRDHTLRFKHRGSSLMSSKTRRTNPIMMKEKIDLPWFLDYRTNGGVIFYFVFFTVVPFFVYNFLQEVLGWDDILAGNVLSFFYSGIAIFGWCFSYLFRVNNEDTAYASQLKEYEDEVIKLRFSELSDEEVEALQGETATVPKEKSSDLFDN
jgi:hypothetical protein